jgi:hypothetical protein
LKSAACAGAARIAAASVAKSAIFFIDHYLPRNKPLLADECPRAPP